MIFTNNRELGYSFYYWRTRDQKEVDFILYENNGFFAFEIKRKKQPSDAFQRGFSLSP